MKNVLPLPKRFNLEEEPEAVDTDDQNELAEEAVRLGLLPNATLEQVQLAKVQLVWEEANIFRLARLAGALN